MDIYLILASLRFLHFLASFWPKIYIFAIHPILGWASVLVLAYSALGEIMLDAMAAIGYTTNLPKIGAEGHFSLMIFILFLSWQRTIFKLEARYSALAPTQPSRSR